MDDASESEEQAGPPDTRRPSGRDSPESDEDAQSNVSQDLVELEDHDFQNYFGPTIDGRLFHSQFFHSHGSLPYPLPADGEEQRRLKRQHEVLKYLVGANCPATDLVDEVFASGTRRALDLCTGIGIWVQEMADKYKRVKFIGVDIVPIQTRHPDSNVQFEIQDVSQRLRYRDNDFDLVHARCTAFSLRFQDYYKMILEVARILRPGGLFISGEFINRPAIQDGSDPWIRCPRTCEFIELTARALALRGICVDLARTIPIWLRQTEQFYDIYSNTYRLPIGEWHPSPGQRRLGKKARKIFVGFAHAVRPLLERSGLRSPPEIRRMIAGYTHELEHVRGLIMCYQVVYARKR